MKSFLKKIIVLLLIAEARIVLQKYKPKIIAVTGSVGKTSTKDAIYAIISEHFSVRKSEKSFNTEFGVPLTILGGKNGWGNPFAWFHTLARGCLTMLLPLRYPEWLVLEIGADRPGDIRRLSEWIKPDVGVITRFGDVPVHVEFFKSREELIKEKAYLAQSVRRGGILVLNADDPDVEKLAQTAKGRVVRYGTSGNIDVAGSNYSLHYEKIDTSRGEDKLVGCSFKVNVGGSSLPVIRRGIIGRQQMYPALAALAVALALDLNLVEATEALTREVVPPGRMRIIEGIRNSIVIDDSYNSSPVALSEALNTLSAVRVSGRAVAVLGDMLELGKFSSEMHRRAGEEVAKATDVLIAVGLRSQVIADTAERSGLPRKSIYEFENSTDAARFLDAFVKEGDCVLIKGSQSMRMERIVEEIMAHPEDKEKLLVRQDEAWLKRM